MRDYDEITDADLCDEEIQMALNGNYMVDKPDSHHRLFSQRQDIYASGRPRNRAQAQEISVQRNREYL